MEKNSKAYEYWGYQNRMAFNPDNTMQQEERQLAAIRDGEELSALPCAMNPDDYFDIKNDSRYS